MSHFGSLIWVSLVEPWSLHEIKNWNYIFFFSHLLSGECYANCSTCPPPSFLLIKGKYFQFFFMSPAVSVTCTAVPGLFVNKPAVLDTREEGGGKLICHLSTKEITVLCVPYFAWFVKFRENDLRFYQLPIFRLTKTYIYRAATFFLKAERARFLGNIALCLDKPLCFSLESLG